MSQSLRLQPGSGTISSLQRAVEWIEFVAQNRDLKHLQSPVANVPFHAVYSLDMILALAFTIIGFWVIFFKHMVWDKRMTNRAKERSPEEEEKEKRSTEENNPNNGLDAIKEQEEPTSEAEDVTNANDAETTTDKKRA